MNNSSETDAVQTAGPSEKHLERKSRIGRLIKILLCAIGVSVFVALATFWYLYRTATAAVPEYEAILEVPEEREVLEEERQRFESQLTTMYSESQKESDWQMSVTEREINAWLATRIKKGLPELEANGLSDPRVLISAESITFAMRSRVGSTKGVLSIEVTPFATEEGELALEVLSAKIGQLSMPVGRIFGLVEQVTAERKLPIRVLQEEGTPILIVNLAAISSSDSILPKLIGFDLREDELLVRGESEVLPVIEPPAVKTIPAG